MKENELRQMARHDAALDLFRELPAAERAVALIGLKSGDLGSFGNSAWATGFQQAAQIAAARPTLIQSLGRMFGGTKEAREMGAYLDELLVGVPYKVAP
jgi:hypothetical protein